MWRNFFKVAIRNISKNKVFSLINIVGLAIGLAGAILIILFIAKELSFDRFHEKSGRIYRMYVDGNIGDRSVRGAWTSYGMAPAITGEIPEIQKSVRMDIYPQQLVWFEGEKYIEDNVVFADSTFFEIFSIDLLQGDPATVLSEPNSVVLTREKARQYFGDMNPIGMALEFNASENYYVVTGVMEEFPDNSHFYCDFLISMVSSPQHRSNDWFTNSIYSYVLLEPDTDYRKVEQKMNEVMLSRIRGQMETVLGVSPEEWIRGGNQYGIFLQPITNIHLNPDIEVGSDICFRPVNDRIYIYIFSLIAFFILLIAGINFMNLSTAQSALRAHEVAMRKVVGSDRSLLIRQFLTESVLLSLFALVLALFIVEVSLPLFNQSMQLKLSFTTLGSWFLLPMIILLAVLLGLLSGIYPAFFLARFQPLDGIKGHRRSSRGSALFRKIMVVLQFTISVAIIVGTLLVANQVRYMLNKNLGFDEEQLVVVDRIHPLGNQVNAFCQEAKKIPGVEAISNSSTYLGFSNRTVTYQIEGYDRSKNFMFDVNYVDDEFLKTYGLELATPQSRFFNDIGPSDTMSVIINEAAINEHKLKEPLNTVILNPQRDGTLLRYKVIGIVEDFHHSSLRKEISPYMMIYKTESNSQSGYLTIRFSNNSASRKSSLKKVARLWDEMTGEQPFQFFYLDNELDKYYRQEERTGRLSLLFAILAIVIACMGLFGLTMFSTQRRIREIGVRKAMGANISDILAIVSMEIFYLLLFSILFAWVISFFFMWNWLQVFPYNIGFTPWIYIAAALVALFIAMVTVLTLALHAARSNPVDTLRYE